MNHVHWVLEFCSSGLFIPFHSSSFVHQVLLVEFYLSNDFGEQSKPIPYNPNCNPQSANQTVWNTISKPNSKPNCKPNKTHSARPFSAIAKWASSSFSGLFALFHRSMRNGIEELHLPTERPSEASSDSNIGDFRRDHIGKPAAAIVCDTRKNSLHLGIQSIKTFTESHSGI